MTVGFEDFVRSTTDHGPSVQQTKLAADGLPEVLEVPQGVARAESAVLPWLYRRMVSAPEGTPRRLVYVLPVNGPAEETFARIDAWLARLGPAFDVGLHLMAGPSRDAGWQRRPERTAIVVGTQDLLLSKALMRGFGDARQSAPVSFGLLNNDAQWVFDDAHRLGPGLATSVELQRLRDLLGTSVPTRSMWMSPARDLLDLLDGDSDSDDAGVRGLDRDALLALFDTAVEPPAADIDRWVCAEADWTVLVARRSWESGAPSDDEPPARKEELCQLPLAEVRRTLDDRFWIRDPLDGRWRHATAEDLRPGMTLVLEDPEVGALKDPARPVFACVEWVTLDRHLMETEEEARDLLAVLAPSSSLPDEQREAVVLAARYHDLGKSHEVFQEMLRSGGGDPPDCLLAKSKAPYSTGHSARPYFRHELVSALMLMSGDHPWLVAYLVAAHHGYVRVSVRPGPDETPLILGVQTGDRTPPIELSTGERFPAGTLQPAAFSSEGWWTPRALSLLNRDDLGPFRLAYLETLVRVSDWRSSARHDGPVDGLLQQSHIENRTTP
jgi:CRISPR-associated endonuclease/helicase Cas3